MKHIICAILAILVFKSGFNQQTEPQKQLTKQDYLEKSKKQKTAAWILSGAGAGAVIIAGFTSINKAADDLGNILTLNQPTNSYAAENILFAVGGAAMLGSIPLFIASGKNKRMANSMSLNLKFEKSTVLQQTGFANINYPALSFRIKL